VVSDRGNQVTGQKEITYANLLIVILYRVTLVTTEEPDFESPWSAFLDSHQQQLIFLNDPIGFYLSTHKSLWFHPPEP
jgi:hypothetical protein